jgi:outer membrane protein
MRRITIFFLALSAFAWKDASAQSDAEKNPPANPAPSSEARMTPAQQRYGITNNVPGQAPEDTDLTAPLTLDRAIRIGLQRQNSIAIAQSQVRSAKAGVTQAKSDYYPQIEPTYQYQTSLSPTGSVVTVNPDGTTSKRRYISSTSKSSLVAARLTLYDSGRREANVAASRYNLQATKYGVLDERQTVILNITTDYYNLLRSREIVKVDQESLHRAETTLDEINAEVEVGSGAKSDTFQAESDLANAKVAVLAAQNDLKIAEANLKNSMGIVYSGSLNIPEEPLATPDPTPDSLTLDDYVSKGYASRSDVKQLEEQIKAQGENVRIARINNGLSVSADVTEGLELQPHTGEARQFNLSLSYPLFNGGATRAAVREAEETLLQSRKNLDQLEQNIRLNIEQAYLTREQNRQQVQAAEEAVKAGQTNYQAASEKQKYGLVNILEVINAEVELVTAQVSLVQAQYDYYIADAQLQRFVGGNDIASAGVEPMKSSSSAVSTTTEIAASPSSETH